MMDIVIADFRRYWMSSSQIMKEESCEQNSTSRVRERCRVLDSYLSCFSITLSSIHDVIFWSQLRLIVIIITRSLSIEKSAWRNMTNEPQLLEALDSYLSSRISWKMFERSLKDLWRHLLIEPWLIIIIIIEISLPFEDESHNWMKHFFIHFIFFMLRNFNFNFHFHRFNSLSFSSTPSLSSKHSQVFSIILILITLIVTLFFRCSLFFVHVFIFLAFLSHSSYEVGNADWGMYSTYRYASDIRREYCSSWKSPSSSSPPPSIPSKAKRKTLQGGLPPSLLKNDWRSSLSNVNKIDKSFD